MAIAALIISIFAVLATGVNAWVNWSNRPGPEIAFEPADGTNSWVVHNHGRRHAFDVRVIGSPTLAIATEAGAAHPGGWVRGERALGPIDLGPNGAHRIVVMRRNNQPTQMYWLEASWVRGVKSKRRYTLRVEVPVHGLRTEDPHNDPTLSERPPQQRP